MTDWATISSLATAGGTLVLAVATFASVRSGRRAARVTERALLDHPEFAVVRDAIRQRRLLTVDLLYGDHEGGQHTISRFSLVPARDDGWMASVSRHWNLDRADPR